MGCGELTQGSQYDCAEPLQGGTMPKLGIFNSEDIASYTYSASTPNLVTNITLKTGKVMNVYEGFKNSVLPSLEKASSPSGQSVWKHICNFFVYENTQAWKNQLEKMGIGKYVTLYRNSKMDANSFELQGIGNGLELQDGAVNAKGENNGAYNLILASAENQFEARPPQTLLSTDYAGTDTLWNTLGAIPTVTVISDLALQVAGGDSETITGTAFHGGGSASAVISVKWVNQLTGAKTTQTAVTVASNTSITFTSVALTAGVYKLEVVTTRGTAISTQSATAS